MKLTLSVKTYFGNALEPSLSITVNQENASLGRRDDNTLVLPDVKKFVSNRHALIEYQSPDYFITDVSTNGTFVNDNKMLPGQEHRLRLQDGDLLMVGDYAIFVMIDEDKRERQKEGSVDCPEVDDAAMVHQDTKILADRFHPVAAMDKLATTGGTANAESMTSGEDVVAEIVASNASLNEPNTLHASTDAPSVAQLQAENDHQAVVAADHEQPKPPLKETSVVDSSQILSVESAVERPSSNHSDNAAGERFLPVDDDRSVNEQRLDLIRSFLLGAGLDVENGHECIDEETFYVIGKVLRVAIEGTMEVLLGRAKIKNEMHLDMTTIRPKQNNPLKFSVTADEALRKLILSKNKEYLSPEAAINEAFDDIKAHQYSVIAGMQSALQVLMQRFNPEKLEGRLKKHSPLARKIPVLKQAKLWSLFVFLYDEIDNEAKDNFFRLFGQVFADAYEEQIRQLKNIKK